MKRKRGFTLTEVMVAISIVTILIALSIGGLSKLARKATDAADLNNLRQLGVGAFQYMGENNGRIPPMMGTVDGKTVYAQEFIAAELGISASLRATNISPKAWGPLISPTDHRMPPYLSPLRCYGVNYYMGEIFTITNDSRITIPYSSVNKPSGVLYFLPMEKNDNYTNPDSQGRFSELTPPIGASASLVMSIRVDDGSRAPALWADGHASMVSLPEVRKNPAKYLYPKSDR